MGDFKDQFARLDAVEVYLRNGTYPVGLSTNGRYTLHRKCKKFIIKDDLLFYSFRNRQRKVVRSQKEVNEILTQFHDDKGHPGKARTFRAISKHCYWCGIVPDVGRWIKKCETCSTRVQDRPLGQWWQQCLAYGCGSTRTHCEESTTFHRFPHSDPKRLELWVRLAQRDQWSVQGHSCLCSKHFTEDCFERTTEGNVFLKPGAVPTVVVSPPAEEPLFPLDGNDDSSFEINTLEDLLDASSDATGPVDHTEHQYALPPPETNTKTFRKGKPDARKTYSMEPVFAKYNAVERYLVTGRYNNSNKGKWGNRREIKRFVIQDGVLYNCQRSTLRRVIRSREEANTILREFHNNRGHYGLNKCLKGIQSQYFWGTSTRDVTDWIINCDQCDRGERSRPFQCSVYMCNNYSGPVERGLGLTFHLFPIHNPVLLSQWLKSLERPQWHPRPRSVVCSSHFPDHCFDRTRDTISLKPDAVPSLFLFHPSAPSMYAQGQGPLDPEGGSHGLRTAAKTRDQAFFAKYDAVEKYIVKRIYPPGLTFVEKNTIRRFCKNFSIKDGSLHISRRGVLRKVLRSREEVEETLGSYHDQLNHLGLKQCMRLLNERLFWSTMTADVARWIQNCSVCSQERASKKARMEPSIAPESKPEESSRNITSTQPLSGDGGGDDDDDDDDDNDAAEGVIIESAIHTLTDFTVEHVVQPMVHRLPLLPPTTIKPIHPLPKTTIKPMVRPRPQTTIKLLVRPPPQSTIKAMVHPPPQTTITPMVRPAPQTIIKLLVRPVVQSQAQPSKKARMEPSTAPESEPVESSRNTLWMQPLSGDDDDYEDDDDEDGAATDSGRVIIKSTTKPAVRPPPPTNIKPMVQQPIIKQPIIQLPPVPVGRNAQDGLVVHQCVYLKQQNKVLLASATEPGLLQLQPGVTNNSQPGPTNNAQPVATSRPQRVTRSQWVARPSIQPVTTKMVSGNIKMVTTKTDQSETIESKQPDESQSQVMARVKTPDSPVVDDDTATPQRPGQLQARTVIQQCSQAKLKVKPPGMGAENSAEDWVEIQEGMVIYVCFFKDATKDIIPKMVDTLLNTKLFRDTGMQQASVLELPGSVLILPQDTLTGQPADRRKMKYQDIAERRWGAQLYAKFVSGCEETLGASSRCVSAGCTIQHGSYGRRQEIWLNSKEPFTHLVEF